MRRVCTAALVTGLMVISLTGCSGQNNAAKPTGQGGNRDLSLEHYIQGSLLDQKGDYARAILEYQDALRYQRDAAIYHSLAKDYAILGKNDLALENARQAVQMEPGNRDYRETLGKMYITAMDIDGAIEQYSALVKIDSTSHEAWMDLARLQQVRNPDKALGVYRAMIERFGPDDGAYFQMAQIYAAKHDLANAAASLKELLALDPGNADVKKALGDLYLQQDSVDTALTIYNDLVHDHPENIELRAAIAHAYLVKHDYTHASEQFESVMSQDTISVDDQIRFGRVFLTFLQKDSAVAPYASRLFEQIRSRHPSDWRPYWFLGAIDNMMKNDSGALVNYNRVRELARDNPDGWVGVASVYYDRNDLDSVISVLNEAKTVVQPEFRVFFLLGVTYQRKHDTTNAVDALQQAIRLDPKNVDAISALALTYDEMKRHEDSDTMYERALQIDPKNHLLLNNYSYSLAERGLQLDRALGMSKQAVSQQPDNQSYLDTYGWICFRMGNYREAEQWIRKAIDLGSKSAVVNEHLGDVYSKLSEKEKAIEYWSRALQIDPGNESLRDKIRRGSL